ncbi:MAG: BtpA/SgcQ family protein [Polyangiaceae bacterium]|jgi:membrane complex biogenesis BtpA family protein
MTSPSLRRLVGVVHLPALPGSPCSELGLDAIVEGAVQGAKVLAEAGYDLCMIENYGDVPFHRGAVPAITVATMAIVAREVARATSIPLGVNVLRNDGLSALAIAHAVGAKAVRVNVLSGARVTDQGVVEGDAAVLLRERASLGAKRVEVWADVDVKHSSPLGPQAPIEHETADLVVRALADAVLVTGEGTGHAVDGEKLARVRAAVEASGRKVPVIVASGATIAALPALAAHAHGVVVGSALRANGKAGGPIDPRAAAAFADAFREAFASV